MPRLQLWLGNRGIDGDAYVLGLTSSSHTPKFASE